MFDWFHSFRQDGLASIMMLRLVVSRSMFSTRPVRRCGVRARRVGLRWRQSVGRRHTPVVATIARPDAARRRPSIANSLRMDHIGGVGDDCPARLLARIIDYDSNKSTNDVIVFLHANECAALRLYDDGLRTGL